MASTSSFYGDEKIGMEIVVKPVQVFHGLPVPVRQRIPDPPVKAGVRRGKAAVPGFSGAG